MARRVLRNRFALLLAEKAEREGRAKISREEVAEVTGLGMSTLSRYANNKVELYADHVLLALCDYFGCTVGDLFTVREEGDEDAEEPSKYADPLLAVS